MSRTVMLLPVLFACSSDPEGSTVRVAFTPTANAPARTLGPPVRLEYRVLAIYLSETESGTNLDVDGDGVDTVRIWEDPGCMGDLGRCDASASDDGTYTHTPSTWFDLMEPEEDLNAALNAQDVAVPAQTWRRVGLEACKVNDGLAPTVRWEGPSGIAAEYDDCGFVEVVFDEPLVTTGAEAVEVALTFDPSQSLQVGEDAEGDSCVQPPDGEKECVSLPGFGLQAQLLAGDAP